MKTTKLTKILSIILCMVLTAAAASFTLSCSDKPAPGADSPETISAENILGVGDTKFTLTVTGYDGVDVFYEISTDKTTVGDALTELGLISGDEGPFGLYVKTVTEITADYDKDGKYWAFYVNGEMASSGIDSTNITPGDTYSFRVE